MARAFYKKGNGYDEYPSIAKLAGVSVSTVSRVLNEHPYVKEEKRQKVLEAVEQLNYIKTRMRFIYQKGKRTASVLCCRI